MPRITDSRIYAAAFACVLGSAAVMGVTYAHGRLGGRVRDLERVEEVRPIVESLGLVSGSEPAREIVAAYDRHVTPARRGPMDVYEARVDGHVLGYAFEVAGRGHGGQIKAVLALDAAGERILGLRVRRQSESEGLGTEITSLAWQRKFEGRPVRSGSTYGFTLDRTGSSPSAFPLVTGASETSRSVCLMLNESIAQFLSGGKKMVELDLGINKPNAVTRATPGYPRDWVKPPNLRPEARGRSFLVPEGLVNLARGKPVTSSDPMPVIGELPQITDGVMTCNEGDFVELGNGPQWVQIDLGEARAIHAVAIWFYYKNPIIYSDVIVRVADDPDFTRNVRVLFNNDHDNSSGLGTGKDPAFFARWWGEVIDARDGGAGTRARYVRVQTNGSTGDKGNCYVEIAVYGNQGP
ncbi:MAG: FMN-binding protein [Planctomycetota bacterium]|nr:FMN-binding protein [Planctomycetota bacterium]